MMSYKKYISVLILVLFSSVIFAQDHKCYDAEIFVSQSDTLQYRILMPKDFNESKEYPVVLFLHGAGERGNDNTTQLTHGSKLFTEKQHRKDFPAIVIFPQCPKDSYWASVNIDRTNYPLKIEFPQNAEPTKPLALVMELMDQMVLKPYVSKNQVYIVGMSMGGMGTYEILHRKSNMFAAAIAICGAGNPDTTKAYATTTPIWAFHGANDNVIEPQFSIDMVSGILKYGGKPKFTLYSKDNHNSWDTAFAEPDLLPWLFSNIKN